MAERILILIPAYNEAPRIARVITAVQTVVPKADILVINDGSTDLTALLARRSGANVVSLPYNMGYGVALQTGYKYARRKEYDIIVQMDADGQHEPKSIPAMLQTMKERNADIVLGSRWLGQSNYRGPLLRKFGKFYFSFLASLITHYTVTDPTTGFQVLTAPVVNFFCRQVYPSDYPDADVIIMLHRAGFRVAETPVIMYRDDSGQSMHSGLRPIYYGMKMMMSIFMTLLRDDRQIREWVNNE